MFWGAMLAAGLAAGTATDGQEAVTYSYDVHGRLVQLSHTTGPNAGTQTTYTFDANTNRTARTTTGASTMMAADSARPSETAEDPAAPEVAPAGPVHLEVEAAAEPGAPEGAPS